MMSNYTVPVRLEGFVFRVPVSIVNKEDAYYYLVKEPRCDNQCTNLKAKIIDSMRQRNQSLQDAINEVLSNVGDKQVVEAVLYHIMRDLRGYGPITVPLFDPDIEEVELNNWSHPITVVHRDLPGIRLITNIRFNSEVEAKDFIMSMSKRGLPRSVSLLKPYIETILPEGHRFTGTIGEITIGPTFSIRKFPPKPMALEELVSREMLSPSAAAYLWLMAEFRGFIMISGPMSSGKTTLLGAIVSKLPMYAKIITIEDTPEIRIPHPHWVRMFTRDGDDDKSRIEMFDLIKLAVRYRPDYIIVGEVRGEEVHADAPSLRTRSRYANHIPRINTRGTNGQTHKPTAKRKRWQPTININRSIHNNKEWKKTRNRHSGTSNEQRKPRIQKHTNKHRRGRHREKPKTKNPQQNIRNKHHG